MADQGAVQLDQIMQQMQQQENAQKMLEASLWGAIQRPIKIVRFNTHMTVLQFEEKQRVIVVGTPQGERYEIPLDERMAKGVGEALLKERPPNLQAAA